MKGKNLCNIWKHRSCAGNKNLKGNTWYCTVQKATRRDQSP